MIDEIEQATKDEPDDVSPEPADPDEEKGDTALIDALLNEEMSRPDQDNFNVDMLQSEYVPAALPDAATVGAMSMVDTGTEASSDALPQYYRGTVDSASAFTDTARPTVDSVPLLTEPMDVS